MILMMSSNDFDALAVVVHTCTAMFTVCDLCPSFLLALKIVSISPLCCLIFPVTAAVFMANR